MSRTHIYASSDWHCGSSHGLAVPGEIPIPSGGYVTPSDTALMLYELFDADLKALKAQAEGCSRKIMLLNGDLTDGGMHHGTVELHHPDPGVEKHIVGECVEHAIRTYEPTDVFVIAGTPSHVGKSAGREESVAKMIEGMFPKLLRTPSHGRRRTWGVLKFDAGGLRFDVRHHGKLGRLPHTRESYQKRYAFDIWSSHAMYGRTPPDVAIRSHLHKYVDSGPPSPVKPSQVRLFSLPCYQLGTEWVRKVAIEEPPDLGALGLIVGDGRLQDVLARVEIPELPEEVWQP